MPWKDAAESGRPASRWWPKLGEHVRGALSSGDGDGVYGRRDSKAWRQLIVRKAKKQHGKLERHKSDFLRAWKLLNGQLRSGICHCQTSPLLFPRCQRCEAPIATALSVYSKKGLSVQ